MNYTEAQKDTETYNIEDNICKTSLNRTKQFKLALIILNWSYENSYNDNSQSVESLQFHLVGGVGNLKPLPWIPKL